MGIIKIQFIYNEVLQSGKPVFCIVDDIISSQTKPSSRALHPVEEAYFHHPHLKGEYDKSRLKVKIVQEIANELPILSVVCYLLCDSWYICGEIMKAFIKKGFYTIGALKTNWILYLCGIKQKVSEFAWHLRKTDADVSFVTVGSRSYYIYWYEGSLNGIDNAVVLNCYPKDAFHVHRALRTFISTDVSLSTQKILDKYVEW